MSYSTNRITNAAQVYKQKYWYAKRVNGIDTFLLSNYEEIKEIIETKGIYEGIEIALQGGFIIGYRKAKRETQNK